MTAANKELTSHLAVLDDAIKGYEHVAKAWEKATAISKPFLSEVDDTPLPEQHYAKAGLLLRGIHDALKSGEGLSAEELKDALDASKQNIISQIEEVIEAIDSAISTFRVLQHVEGMDGVLTGFRTAKRKMESAMKKARPLPGRTLH